MLNKIRVAFLSSACVLGGVGTSFGWSTREEDSPFAWETLNLQRFVSSSLSPEVPRVPFSLQSSSAVLQSTAAGARSGGRWRFSISLQTGPACRCQPCFPKHESAHELHKPTWFPRWVTHSSKNVLLQFCCLAPRNRGAAGGCVSHFISHVARSGMRKREELFAWSGFQ